MQRRGERPSVSIFRKRLHKFRTIKRGYYSFLILLAAYGVSFFLPLLVSSSALLVRYDGTFVFSRSRNTTRRRRLASRRSASRITGRWPQTLRQQHQGNWALMPLYPYSPTESLLDLPGSPPNAPSRQHIFGTDDRGRDIFARLAYGFNVSLSFALLVLAISLGMGVSIGAMLGYFGGKVDLTGQRLIEIWSSLPFLYTIIIVSSIVVPIYLPGRNLVLQPSFWLLIVILTAFDWMGITYYVRGEFYREKAKDYVAAAISIGRFGPRHHLQAYSAELAHACRFLRPVHGRRQHQRAGGAGFSWLWPARAHAQLGRIDRAGRGQSDEMVAGVFSAGRDVRHSAAHCFHRRGGARSLRSQGIFETAVTTTPAQAPLLQIRGLKTYFHTEAGTAKAVDGLDLDIFPGEVVGLVGESGSGKSVTALSVLRLIPDPPGKIARIDPLQGPGPAEALLGRNPRGARQRDQHDFSGADDLAESGVHDRHAADGGGAGARARVAKGSVPAIGRDAGTGGNSGPGLAHERLSAAVFRRHAAARDDRHGAGMQSVDPHCRRADDGSGRHHPGANSRTHAAHQGPAARTRPFC